jgi:hypothetical protein
MGWGSAALVKTMRFSNHIITVLLCGVTVALGEEYSYGRCDTEYLCEHFTIMSCQLVCASVSYTPCLTKARRTIVLFLMADTHISEGV